MRIDAPLANMHLLAADFRASTRRKASPRLVLSSAQTGTDGACPS